LHDHIHKLAARVGVPYDIALEMLSYRELGIKGYGKGTTQAVVMYSEISKRLNEEIFNQYKDGLINQHSVGLQYMNIKLAINNEDYKSEFAAWEDSYSKIINKEKADDKGYFWAVSQWKMVENSAVLFGSNEITPTLANNLKHEEPDKSTPEQPDKSTEKSETSNKKQFIKQLIIKS